MIKINLQPKRLSYKKRSEHIRWLGSLGLLGGQSTAARERASMRNRGKSYHTETWKKELSLRMKKNNPMFDPDIRSKQREAYYSTGVEKIRTFFKTEKGVAHMDKIHHDHEISRRRGESMSKWAMANPDRVSAKVARMNDKLTLDDRRRIGMLGAIKWNNADPADRKRAYGVVAEKQSAHIKSLSPDKRDERTRRLHESRDKWWDTISKEERSERAAKMRTPASCHPNGLESDIISICLEFSIPLKYTGNGALRIATPYGILNPDFACSDFGSKKLVEIFGDYWHGPSRKLKFQSTEVGRKSILESVGYGVLIIWEKEIRSSPRRVIAEKLLSFVRS